MAADLYISADIEADGPIPGKNSMLAFGLAVAGRFDGGSFEARDPSATTFYHELRPISNDVDRGALRGAGLDRDRLKEAGALPADAMAEAARWIQEQAGPDRPVLVGYPSSSIGSSCTGTSSPFWASRRSASPERST